VDRRRARGERPISNIYPLPLSPRTPRPALSRNPPRTGYQSPAGGRREELTRSGGGGATSRSPKNRGRSPVKSPRRLQSPSTERDSGHAPRNRVGRREVRARFTPAVRRDPARPAARLRTHVSHTQNQHGMQPFVQLKMGNFTYTSPPDPFSLYRLELYTPGGERADLLIYLSLSLLFQNEAVGWCVTHHTSIRWRMKI
jgi:hypothetical protein